MMPHDGGDCRNHCLGSDAACRRVMTSHSLCETSLAKALVHADEQAQANIFLRCAQKEHWPVGLLCQSVR